MGCRNCPVFLNIQVLSKAFGGADSLPPSAVATAPASPVVAWQRPFPPPQKGSDCKGILWNPIYPKWRKNSGSGTGTRCKGNSLNSGIFRFPDYLLYLGNQWRNWGSITSGTGRLSIVLRHPSIFFSLVYFFATYNSIQSFIESIHADIWLIEPKWPIFWKIWPIQ